MKTEQSARLLNFAKRMRKSPTYTEKKIRSVLMKAFYHPLGDEDPEYRMKMKFQYPLYFDNLNYIVDIYFPKYRVAIELDGGIHKTQETHDLNRDVKIMDKSILLVRFTNKFVLKYPEKFIEQVKDVLKSRGWNLKFKLMKDLGVI